MASKVDTFVTQAAQDLAAIRKQSERLALDAQVLYNKWQALGKTNMAGWAAYTWATQVFTAAELAAALNGLNTVIDAADAVNLTNLHTATKVIDRIVKAGL